jgi:hypothetical protein
LLAGVQDGECFNRKRTLLLQIFTEKVPGSRTHTQVYTITNKAIVGTDWKYTYFQ